MTHPLAGRTCTVVGGEAMGTRGIVVDGYAGLLGTPVGLGRDRIGPQSEMVYVIVFEVTHVPHNLPRDYIGHLFSVRATQVRIDATPGTDVLLPPRTANEPTFNHTRGDGPFNPCPQCLQLMSHSQLIALVEDMRESISDAAARFRERE